MFHSVWLSQRLGSLLGKWILLFRRLSGQVHWGRYQTTLNYERKSLIGCASRIGMTLCHGGMSGTFSYQWLLMHASASRWGGSMLSPVVRNVSDYWVGKQFDWNIAYYSMNRATRGGCFCWTKLLLTPGSIRVCSSTKSLKTSFLLQRGWTYFWIYPTSQLNETLQKRFLAACRISIVN